MSPKENDSARGIEYVIQNVYNAQAIIKSAFPRPVDQETAHRLMARVRCSHPSCWELQAKEEFNVDDFVSEVRSEGLFGGSGGRPPSPTPEIQMEKFRPAILKAPSGFASLKTPSPVRVKVEPKPVNRAIFPAGDNMPLLQIEQGQEQEEEEDEEEFDQIDLVSNPLEHFRGTGFLSGMSSSSAGSSSSSSSSAGQDGPVIHVVGGPGSKKRHLAKASTTSGRLIRKPRAADDELIAF